MGDGSEVGIQTNLETEILDHVAGKTIDVSLNIKIAAGRAHISRFDHEAGDLLLNAESPAMDQRRFQIRIDSTDADLRTHQAAVRIDLEGNARRRRESLRSSIRGGAADAVGEIGQCNSGRVDADRRKSVIRRIGAHVVDVRILADLVAEFGIAATNGCVAIAEHVPGKTDAGSKPVLRAIRRDAVAAPDLHSTIEDLLPPRRSGTGREESEGLLTIHYGGKMAVVVKTHAQI